MAKDRDGRTALDIARRKKCEKIVELLESYERNPNETIVLLRKQLGFSSNFLFRFLFEFFFFLKNKIIFLKT